MKILKRLRAKKGLSFMEVMTAAAVLSFGLVMIYQAFFTTLDSYNHVAYRLHALLHIQNKIAWMQQDLMINHRIEIGQGKQLYQTTINNHPVDFELYVQVEALEGILGIYELSVTASWKEGTRNISISRQTYIYHIADQNEA